MLTGLPVRDEDGAPDLTGLPVSGAMGDIVPIAFITITITITINELNYEIIQVNISNNC